MIHNVMNQLRISWDDARKADNLANCDCNKLWKLVMLLEKLGVVSDKEMIKSGELYSFNFCREIHHLKTIRPDLLPELEAVLTNQLYH